MADLTVKLAVAQAELAQEKKTTSELRTQLDAVTAELKGQLEKFAVLQSTSAGLNAEIGGLRAELKTKDKMADDLRHSQAMWSSMFMSKSEVSSSTFQSFMNATSGRGAGEP
jgi:chromosome segregation ATPase